MTRKRQVVEAELVDENALAVPDLPGAVAVPHNRAEDLYAAFLADKSELTANNYRIDLQAFATYLTAILTGSYDAAGAIQWLCARRGPEANEAVFHYKAYLKGSTGARKYSASTINRRLAALRSITKLGRMFGLMDWRLEIDGEKARTFKDTTGCGVEGLQTLVSTIEQEIVDNEATDTKPQAGRRWRDRALLHLMYYAGLRRMEPLTADYPAHLRRNPQNGDYELSIIGKKRDGEREWVPIGRTTHEAIEDWLGHRGPDRGPLFPGRTAGEPLKPRSVNDLISRLAKVAGVDVTPHGLRHAAITQVLEKTGGNVRTAQRFARHANPATTMVYDDNRQRVAAQGVAALEDDE